MEATSAHPVVKNVKIHFRFRDKKQFILRIKQKQELFPEFKKHHNFVVFKSQFVYIIFPQSGWVNATKIPTTSKIKDSVTFFLEYFGFTRSDLEGTARIDNITASGSFHQEINLNQLHNFDSSECVMRYDPNYFPGVFIKVFNEGTIIVFRKGSYSIIGAKCATQVQSIYRKTAALIQML